MSFSMLSVAILLLFAVISGIEIYKGVKKGFIGALISLGTVVSSLVVTVTVMPLAINVLVRFLVKKVFQYLPFYDLYKSLIDSFVSLEELAIGLVSMLLSILGFLVFFFVFRDVFRIIFGIIRRVLTKKRKDDIGYCRENEAFLYRHDKLMGGIVGAFSAVLVTMAVISPFMGSLEVIDKSCEIVDVFGEEAWLGLRLKSDEVNTVRRYYKDIPGSVFYHMGGKYMFRAVSTTIMYKEKVYLFNELDAIYDVAVNASEAYSVIQSPKDAKPGDADKVRSLGESVSELKMVRGVLAELLSKSAKTWQSGGKVLGIALPEMPSLIQKTFDEVLTVCAETNRDSIKYNMVTLLNLYALIIDTDMMNVDFTDFSAALQFLDDSNLIDRVNEEFSKNRYTKHIRVTSITMSAVAQQLNGNNLSSEDYDKLSDGLADMINQINGMNYSTSEEKADVLKETAKKYVGDAMGEDVEIPEAVIDAVSIELIKELEGDGNVTVTAEDVKSVFDKYAQQ